MGTRTTGVFEGEELSFFGKEDLDKFRRISYQKGSMIYAQKKLFMIILKGEGKLNTYHESGREYVLSYFRAGSFVLVDTFSSFEITKDAEILEANLSTVIDLFEFNQDFAIYLFNSFLKNMTMQKNVIKELVFDSVETRTYKFLLQIANGDIAHVNGGVSEIASFVGAPRQNVSVAVNKLIKNKKIQKLDHQNFKILP
ncbi:Crp/Fnr family transcriptional regulator [Campylobacter sp. VBCF_06 NA8]|uniref:Crp/Fnr family transcriptional regulator n=1 Tax=Campylobacter sp. VBCF_06 NA8 TaxID=2983822 RepID=UPI0022E9DCE8|nr:Crp/Fnr family transcriptional regulator [Campylobacter sp. VBCF_06 NA8]MDA3045664.1 Crp/Fnr family transcriptional regulator [Campylobacter sp. VBCF_06 NA8]